MISSPIYKRDTAGRLRSWQYELDGDRYRTIAGLVDGQKAVSGWTICTPKSRPTAAEQADFEAKAAEQHKLTREYHPTPDTTETPNFTQPMLAHGYDKGMAFPLLSQPKLDGIRAVTSIEGIASRQGKPILACPHISDAVGILFDSDPDLILDGELYNHDLKADFEKIVSLVRKQKPTADELAESRRLVQFHVYDIISMSDRPFVERIERLRRLVDRLPEGTPVRLVTTRLAADQEALDLDYAEFLEAGYEGQMLRNPKSLYENKRSKNLLKRKEFEDGEFEIVEIEEGQGNWAGFAKKATLRLADGRTFGSGIRGSQDRMRELLADRTSWVGRQATCRYQNLTSDGIPRFPVIVAFHEGARL